MGLVSCVCGNDSKRKSKSEKSQSVTDVAGAVVELPQAAVLLYDQACALVETKVRVRCAYAAELLTHSFTSRDLRFTPSHVYHLRVPCTQFASMRRSAKPESRTYKGVWRTNKSYLMAL